MPSLKFRGRSLAQRSLLALVPVAVLAAVFALGVPVEGSGEPCKTDADCRDGEACGEDKCESTAGGCGGEQDSGIGVASNQAESALFARNQGVLGFEANNVIIVPPTQRSYTVKIGETESKSYTGVWADNSFRTSLTLETFMTGPVLVIPLPPPYYGGPSGGGPPPMCGRGQEGLDWGHCTGGGKCEAFPDGGFVCSGGGTTSGEVAEGEGEGEGGSHRKLACNSPTWDPVLGCMRNYCDEDGDGTYSSADLGLVLLHYGSLDHESESAPDRRNLPVQIRPNWTPTNPTTAGSFWFPRFNPAYRNDSGTGDGESVNGDDLAQYLATMGGASSPLLGDCAQDPPDSSTKLVSCNSPTWDPVLECMRDYCDEDGDGTFSSADLGLVLLNFALTESSTVVKIRPNWTKTSPTAGEFNFPRFNPAYDAANGLGPEEWVNDRDVAYYLAMMDYDASTVLGRCTTLPPPPPPPPPSGDHVNINNDPDSDTSGEKPEADFR